MDAASLVGGVILGVGGSLLLFLTPPGQAFLVSLRTALRISGRHASFLDSLKAAFQRPVKPPEEEPPTVPVVFRRMRAEGQVTNPTGQVKPAIEPEFKFN